MHLKQVFAGDLGMTNRHSAGLLSILASNEVLFISTFHDYFNNKISLKRPSSLAKCQIRKRLVCRGKVKPNWKKKHLMKKKVKDQWPKKTTLNTSSVTNIFFLREKLLFLWEKKPFLVKKPNLFLQWYLAFRTGFRSSRTRLVCHVKSKIACQLKAWNKITCVKTIVEMNCRLATYIKPQNILKF